MRVLKAKDARLVTNTTHYLEENMPTYEAKTRDERMKRARQTDEKHTGNGDNSTGNGDNSTGNGDKKQGKQESAPQRVKVNLPIAGRNFAIYLLMSV